MTSLELRGIAHRYTGNIGETLSDISLEVPAGKMTAIIGPSGSGKSTLLRVAAGFEKATSGQVLLGGVDVGHLPAERRDLTVMFQSPLLFDHLDVAGNVAFAPRISGVQRRQARHRAEKYLALVGLGGFGKRRVDELSGGQQQRAALARALAAEKGVLLLDEPFSSLDRELRTAMHALLEDVRAQLSPTILMVTHDLDEAAIADEVAVLINGEIEQQGAMSELYERPSSLAVAALVGGFSLVAGESREGWHHSAWGSVRIAPDSPMATTNGPAYLLLRRESLVLRLAGELTPAPSRNLSIGGATIRHRQSGTRAIVTIAVDSTDPLAAEIEVELPPGQTPKLSTTGTVHVELATPETSCWALAANS